LAARAAFVGGLTTGSIEFLSFLQAENTRISARKAPEMIFDLILILIFKWLIVTQKSPTLPAYI
jgi:hypothetical protein